MDDFLLDIYVSVFKEWILNLNIEGMDIIDHGDEVFLENHTYIGKVSFNHYHIIELEIENKVSLEKVFYLHFQMNTIHHALKLFKEMLECMSKKDGKHAIKVLLSCSGGLTTSYFSSLLNDMAKKMHNNIITAAVGCRDIYNKAVDYDIILLAPQISYMEVEAKKTLPSKIVKCIPPKIFAQYDCGSLFDFIYETLQTTNKEKDVLNISFKAHTTIQHQTLSLAIFRNSQRVHVAYRLYDLNGKIILNKEIIKPTISIQDLFDVIDLVLFQYPHVEDIGLSIPGIINNGYVESTSVKYIENVQLLDILKERYQQNIYLSNDVNSAAIGYYVSQKESSNIAFLFQPIHHEAGIGLVVEGSLLKGKNNLAGEAQYLPLKLSKKRNELNKTPDGSIELVSCLILTIIAMMAPEIIVFYNEFISDEEVIYKELEKVLPRQYLPKIMKIDDMVEYCLMGQMALCVKKEMG